MSRRHRNPGGTGFSLCVFRSAREGARMSKQVRFRREIRTHWIEFDISNDIVPLLRRPHPTIERFILPKRLTRSAQQRIGLLRGHSLHIWGDLRRGSLRFDQKVDVVRHDNKRDEVVQSADPLAIANGFCDGFGDSRLFEPAGTERCAVEFAVGCNKGAPVAARSQREGAVQSKRNEQRCSVGLKMGEVAAVFHAIVVARTVGISQCLHRRKPVPRGAGEP